MPRTRTLKAVSPRKPYQGPVSPLGPTDLSVSDMLVSTELTTLEIPELPKNGKPGVVHLRVLSAGDMLQLFADKGSVEGGILAITNMPHEMVALAVVHSDGTPMFASADQVRRLRLDVFNRISGAVLGVQAPADLMGKAKLPSGGDSRTV